jgi:chemotaxis protein CheD
MFFAAYEQIYMTPLYTRSTFDLNNRNQKDRERANALNNAESVIMTQLIDVITVSLSRRKENGGIIVINFRLYSLSPSLSHPLNSTLYLSREVSTGEVRTGRSGEIIIASALGSCIAVIIYDPVMRIGGLAHIMLPGKAPSGIGGRKRLRYAYDAIDELLYRLNAMGTDKQELRICIAGGGNVLRRDDDVICEMNLRSVLKILRQKGLTIKTSSTGGYERRKVSLDVSAGRVLCSVGSEKEHILLDCRSV